MNSNSDLSLKMIELAKKEINLEEINKKIEIVLKKVDLNNDVYDSLVATKNDMRRVEAKRNKKYIALATILMTLACLIMIFVVGEILAMFAGTFKIIEWLLSAYRLIDGLIGLFIVGYEIGNYFKISKDEEHLCKDLVKSKKYQRILEQIKDKERETKYLDMEYESLVTERDNLEIEIYFDKIDVFSNGDKMVIENISHDTKIIKDDEMQEESKNNGLVRRRNMREESKNNKKKGEF